MTMIKHEGIRLHQPKVPFEKDQEDPELIMKTEDMKQQVVDRILKDRLPKVDRSIIPAPVERMIRRRVQAYLVPKIELLVKEGTMKKQTKNQIDHLVRRVARLEIDQWRKADHDTAETKAADLVTYWRDMNDEDKENVLDQYVANDKELLTEALVSWKGRQKQSGAAYRKRPNREKLIRRKIQLRQGNPPTKQ